MNEKQLTVIGEAGTPDVGKHSLSSMSPSFTLEGPIARITLRRPRHQNRLEDEDLGYLLECFQSINADHSIRILVIDAQVHPERPVFSAGYHIDGFEHNVHKPSFELVMNELEALRPVTICVLNGNLYGGATDIPLACDLAVAADDVIMVMPAARLGLHFYPQGLRRYVSRIGLRATKLAFLTAEPLDSGTMLATGYVHKVIPRAGLTELVDSLVCQIVDLAPVTTQLLKKSLNEIAAGSADGAELTRRADSSLSSAEFAEGRAAFVEKRKPTWTQP